VAAGTAWQLRAARIAYANPDLEKLTRQTKPFD
jgi:hypothetical protein